MQQFLSTIAATAHVPQATGLSKDLIVDFYDFIRFEVLRGSDVVISTVKNFCEEMLKYDTLSTKLRQDLSDYSTLTCGTVVLSMTSHEFKTIWTRRGDDKQHKNWKDAIPWELYKLIDLIGAVLKNNVVMLAAGDQAEAKKLYKYYYGPLDTDTPKPAVRAQVTYEWKEMAIRATTSFMKDGKLDRDLFQKISLMFLEEPLVYPASVKVDAKWRDYVEEYFNMIMKKKFDPDVIARICKEACLEAHK